MPKQHQERIRPVSQQSDATRRKPVVTEVVASPVKAPPMVQDDSFAQVIDGLKTFNNALERYQTVKDGKDAEEAIAQGRTAGREAQFDPTDPMQAINTLPAMPDSVNPAFSAHYAQGYKETLGSRMGDESRSNLLRQYLTRRNEDGFEVEGFLQDYTKSELTGIEDPQVRAEITKAHVEAVKEIRGDFHKVKLGQLQFAAKANAAATMDGDIQPHMSPQQLFTTFQEVTAPKLVNGIFTRPEASAMFVERIGVMSNQMGGAPELFDALTMFKDPKTGMTIEQANPGLGQAIATQRQHASTMRDKRLSEEVKTRNFETLASLEDRVKSGGWVSDEEIISHMNPLGVFKTVAEAMAFRRMRDAAFGEVTQLAHAVREVGAGRGAYLKPDLLKKAVEEMTKAPVQSMVEGATNGNNTQYAMAMRDFIGVHESSGTAYLSPILTQMTAGIKGMIPQVVKGEAQPPSKQFEMLAKMYKDLPDHIRSLYYDEDSAKIMRNYLDGINTQRLDPASALSRAYQSVSPEAKERGRQLMADPEWQKSVAKVIKGIGTPDFLRNWAPWGKAMGVYPQDDALIAEATVVARDYILRNPEDGPASLAPFLERWQRDNFVHDTTTNRWVKVPAGYGTDGVRKAISAYTKAAAEEFGEDVNPTLKLMSNGSYELWAANADGVPLRHLRGGIQLQDITQRYSIATNLDPATEGPTWIALKQKLKDGTLTPEEATANAPLLAKVDSMGLLSYSMKAQIERSSSDSFKGRLAELPKVSFGAPTNDNLDASRLPGTKSKTAIASHFMSMNDLTGALTVMGEGVANRAYPDHSSKEPTIGVGYNMVKNAKTLAEDFRRAGIPSDPASLEAIAAGQKEITNDQAMRLFTVVKPRYEGMAKTAVERTAPGLWSKLPPNQRAVLTDLAYQVGYADKSKAVKDYEKVLDSLLKGDNQAAAEALGVSWTKASDGSVKFDEHRNNLRAHMLSSPNGFFSVIGHVAKTPRSRLDSIALKGD